MNIRIVFPYAACVVRKRRQKAEWISFLGATTFSLPEHPTSAMHAAFRIHPRVEAASFEVLTDGLKLYWPAGDGFQSADLQDWLEQFDSVEEPDLDEESDLLGLRRGLELTEDEVRLASEEVQFDEGEFDNPRLPWPTAEMPDDLRKIVMNKRGEVEAMIAKRIAGMFALGGKLYAAGGEPFYAVEASTSKSHRVGAVVASERRWWQTAINSRRFRADRKDDVEDHCRSLGLTHPSERIDVLLPEMVKLRPEMENLRDAVDNIKGTLDHPETDIFREPRDEDDEDLMRGPITRTSYDKHREIFDRTFRAFDQGLASAIEACEKLQATLFADPSVARRLRFDRLDEKIADAVAELEKHGAADAEADAPRPGGP